MRPRWATATMAVGALALLPVPGAHATEVGLRPYGDPFSLPQVDVVDRATSAKLHITYTTDGAFVLTVRERGRAPIEAGRGCTQPARRRVVCRMAVEFDVFVWMGEGDDTVRADGPLFMLSAGPGDDRLEVNGAFYADGGPGRDRLTGDDSVQQMSGGPGADVLRAHGGDDVLYGDGDERLVLGHGDHRFLFRDRYEGGYGADVIAGGRGRDTASWVDHFDGVRVDLVKGTGPGGDRVSSLENAVGGLGDDVLLGTGRANRLSGIEGHDRLVGRAGADELEAYIYDEKREDVFECGLGHDTVSHPYESILTRDCEAMRTWWSPLTFVYPGRAGPGAVEVHAYCRTRSGRCRITATLRSGGTQIGTSGPVDVHAGHSYLTVSLSSPLPGDAVVEVRLASDELLPEGSTRHDYRAEWFIRCAGPPRC